VHHVVKVAVDLGRDAPATVEIVSVDFDLRIAVWPCAAVSAIGLVLGDLAGKPTAQLQFMLVYRRQMSPSMTKSRPAVLAEWRLLSAA
jgi:hypothetical protein